VSIRQSLSDEERQELLRMVHEEDVQRARRLLDPGIAAAQAEWVPQSAILDAVHQILLEIGRPPSPRQTFDA
jgi:hypothetical protein